MIDQHSTGAILQFVWYLSSRSWRNTDITTFFLNHGAEGISGFSGAWLYARELLSYDTHGYTHQDGAKWLGLAIIEFFQ